MEPKRAGVFGVTNVSPSGAAPCAEGARALKLSIDGQFLSSLISGMSRTSVTSPKTYDVSRETLARWHLLLHQSVRVLEGHLKTYLERSEADLSSMKIKIHKELRHV
jgi:hypothetical protein